MFRFSKFFAATTITLAGFSGAAQAAVFEVFEAGSAVQLGSFEAPAGGGNITAGSFMVDGGLFDVPLGGTEQPVYDAANAWITGNGVGSTFGVFTNSVAYNTVDVNSNAISCLIGQCYLSFTTSGDPGVVPPEWYLDFIPPNPANAAAIDFGYYNIAPAAVPLPAGLALLASAFAFGGIALRRHRVT